MSYQNAEKNLPQNVMNPAFTVKGGILYIRTNYTGPAKMGPPAIMFTVDDVGGYLGCERVSPGKFTGNGILKPGEVQTWKYDLTKVKIANDKENGASEINFVKVLQSKSEHLIRCYINGDGKSWITTKITVTSF